MIYDFTWTIIKNLKRLFRHITTWCLFIPNIVTSCNFKDWEMIGMIHWIHLLYYNSNFSLINLVIQKFIFLKIQYFLKICSFLWYFIVNWILKINLENQKLHNSLTLFKRNNIIFFICTQMMHIKWSLNLNHMNSCCIHSFLIHSLKPEIKFPILQNSWHHR